MAHLRKRRNSPYWMATFKDGSGRFVERSTKTADKKLAEEISFEWERAGRKALAGELTHAQVLKVMGEMVFDSTGETVKRESVKDYFNRWIRGKETRKQFTTVKRYRPILNGFLEFVGPTRTNAILSSVTSRELARYRDLQLSEGKSPTTSDFAIKVLSGVFAAALKEGLILTNPAIGVERLNQAGEERLPFSDDQVRKLLENAGEDWIGMILLAYHTGIRLHDASNLESKNIDIANRILSFVESKTASRRKTASKETVVYLHGEFIDWLAKRPLKVGKAPIFTTLYGKPSGSAGGLSNSFRAIMDKAGVVAPLGEARKGKGRQFRKLRFHSLRHTFISRLANAEVSPDVRKAMAGHSSDEIHRKYTHLDISAQAKAVNRLAGVFKSNKVQ